MAARRLSRYPLAAYAGAAIGGALGAIASARIRNTATAHALIATAYNAAQTAARWTHLPTSSTPPTYAPTYVGAAWVAYATWPTLGAVIGRAFGSRIGTRYL